MRPTDLDGRNTLLFGSEPGVVMSVCCSLPHWGFGHVEIFLVWPHICTGKRP